MVHQLKFAYPQVFYLFIPIWICITIYRCKFYKTPTYKYPLTNQIKKNFKTKSNLYKVITLTLRSTLLLSLIFLIARPQWVDTRSKLNLDGVDIMITLDVSGSMQCFDNLQNRQQRIDVAKKEAARFIKKRLNDQIGIVIFGADAISRCPLTLDKNILQHIIHQTKLGIVNTSGTSLGTGIATAINKLKNSKAKNKIIILLTDGRPTPNTEQISVETAIKLAKEYKVKIYTIGIGNKNGGYINTSFGFVEKIPDSIDEGLLQKIASQTNGKFFRASSPVEMKKIYDTIDKLEKTKYQTQMFSKYYEAFASFFWGPTILLITELIIKIFLFKGI